MTKKKAGKTKESKGKKVEVNPDESDPLILFKHYSKQCTSIGIPVNESIKAALLSDSPNAHRQMLLGPKEKNKSSTSIGDGDCRALMHAILGNEENDSFKYTAMEDIRIWSSNIADDGVIAIAKLLRKSPKLKFLDLSSNHISTRGASSLGSSLCSGMNDTLLTLKLDYNVLGSHGVICLAKGLKLNSTLKKLSLNYCNFKQDGCEALKDILCFQRTSLESLHVDGNTIGIQGIEVLSKGLEACKTLKRLSIAEIGLIPSDDITSCGEMMSNNSSLEDVDLSRNCIGDANAEKLISLLQDNKRIKILKVTSSLSPSLYEKLSRTSVQSKGSKKSKKKKKK